MNFLSNDLDITGYASIFKTLFPRSVALFEDITNTFQDRILNVDIYGDLDHLPIALRRKMRRDIKVMNSYYQIFGSIARCLMEGRVPNISVIEQDINYSWSRKNEDAKHFLQVGGSVSYPLLYLVEKIKSIICSPGSLTTIEEGLNFLSNCLNDTALETVRERLVENN